MPKALADVHDLYPILIYGKRFSHENIDEILHQLHSQPVERNHFKDLDVLRSPRFIVISYEKNKLNNSLFEELVQLFIFFREFSDQLKQYLNLHREMWETISAIREAKKLRYKQFTFVRYQLLQYMKTLSFVEARLEQMEDILRERKIASHMEVKKLLIALGLNRFDHLESNWKYIDHLWKMTTEYTQGTLELMESLYEENTQKELNTLKYITFIAAITGFFGMNIAFPWEERWNDVWITSFFVLIVIVLVLLLFHLLLKILIHNRYFPLYK